MKFKKGHQLQAMSYQTSEVQHKRLWTYPDHNQICIFKIYRNTASKFVEPKDVPLNVQQRKCIHATVVVKVVLSEKNLPVIAEKYGLYKMAKVPKRVLFS